MISKRLDKYSKRRMIGSDGLWYLFCRLCGDYKPETEFYNSKDTPFGKTYKCKIHYQKDTVKPDSEMDYLKLNAIKDSDLEQTEVVLKNLGYKIGPGELPIWKQFEIKHKIN